MSVMKEIYIEHMNQREDNYQPTQYEDPQPFVEYVIRNSGYRYHIMFWSNNRGCWLGFDKFNDMDMADMRLDVVEEIFPNHRFTMWEVVGDEIVKDELNP